MQAAGVTLNLVSVDNQTAGGVGAAVVELFFSVLWFFFVFRI